MSLLNGILFCVLLAIMSSVVFMLPAIQSGKTPTAYHDSCNSQIRQGKAQRYIKCHAGVVKPKIAPPQGTITDSLDGMPEATKGRIQRSIKAR